MTTQTLLLLVLTQLGTINGQIRDLRTHAAIPMARVELLRARTPVDTEITDSEGRFRFTYVAPGPYTISVDHADYQASSIEIDAPSTAFPVFVDLARKRVVETKASVRPLREYLVPKGAQKEFDRGRDSVRQQDCSSAIVHFEKGLRLFDGDASAHNELGNCYRKVGRFDRAEDSFKRARALTDSEYVVLNLAEVYTSQKRFDEAETLLLETIKQKPQAGDAYYGLALVYMLENRVDDAEAASLQADARKHKIADVHLVLAEIYRQKQNGSAAVEQLQRYLREEPNGPQAARVREILAGH
jgi:tetratricopeptide (TPR) repeat protein